MQENKSGWFFSEHNVYVSLKIHNFDRFLTSVRRFLGQPCTLSTPMAEVPYLYWRVNVSYVADL